MNALVENEVFDNMVFEVARLDDYLQEKQGLE